MKNVISVDTILLNLAQDWYGVGKTYAADINPAHKSLEKAKQAMHSLLISKLPEKRPVITADDLPKMKASNEGYNSAIDDMHQVIDEMFGVQK